MENTFLYLIFNNNKGKKSRLKSKYHSGGESERSQTKVR